MLQPLACGCGTALGPAGGIVRAVQMFTTKMQRKKV